MKWPAIFMTGRKEKNEKNIRILAGAVALCLLLPGSPARAEEATEEKIIGVVVYDPDSAEMEMFMNYYRDYIEEGFPVKFYFSDAISSSEEENAFIDSMKEIGAEGIISFYGTDVESSVKTCEKDELYYVLGSGTISEETFRKVEDNPWFLGTVGPEAESEYQAGYSMAEYFEGKDAASFLIMTGGASQGNFMHASRVKGMLESLQEKKGLILTDSAEKLAESTKITELSDETGNLKVTLCPGYTENGDGLSNLEQAFSNGTFDVVMSSFHAYTFLEQIKAQEEKQNSDIQVGAVDSFNENNFEAVQEEDAFGNPEINYIEGKYASMAGPAFAMVYNAITGHPETVSEDGKAVRLYQGFWTAESEEEYTELYGYTTGIYENAYSCEDLMQVIRVFDEEAGPEKLKALTEAYTVEDVKERILG